MSDALLEIHINMQGRVVMRYAGGKCVDVTDERGLKLYSALQALQSGEPVARDDAPSNSLPSYAECVLRVENTKHVEERIKAGGFGFEDDGLYASQLHKFIYEYDDFDPYRSAWFLHRLELLINEITSANATPQPVVDVFDSLISPAILSFAKGEDELLVRRIWDKVRVAMLSAGKGGE